MKKIAIGVLIGFFLAYTTTAFADNIKQYILTKINYFIVVNGTIYTNSALPALNYEGTTYLPLKAIGDVLGSLVKWNADLKRVEVGESGVAMPTPSPKPTLSRKLFNYDPVMRIDDNNYILQDELLLSVDENNDYYIMERGSIPALISYSYEDYVIKASVNPYIKGIIVNNNPRSYYTEGYKYLNSKEGCYEYTYYNKEHTKSYFVSYKPDDM